MYLVYIPNAGHNQSVTVHQSFLEILPTQMSVSQRQVMGQSGIDDDQEEEEEEDDDAEDAEEGPSGASAPPREPQEGGAGTAGPESSTDASSVPSG